MSSGNVALASASRRPLYSAGGIRLLSLLFNTVVGGVMTARNLKDVQQPRAARVALGGSILYTGLTLYLLARFSSAPFIPWLSWLTSLLGGLGLEAYGRQFIADWQIFPVKSNFKPLVISLTILGLFFAALAYAISVAAHLRRE